MKILDKLRGLSRTDRIFAIIAIMIPVICSIPLIYDSITDRHFNSYNASDILVIEPDSEKKNASKSDRDIMNGNVLEQSFKCSAYSIVGITFYVDAYLSKFGGTLCFDLTDEGGDILETWSVELTDINDDGIIELNIADPSKRLDMSGRTYIIKVYPLEINKGSQAVLSEVPGNRYEDGILSVNGEKTDYDLAMTINGIVTIIDNDHVKRSLCIYAMVALEVLCAYIRRIVNRRQIIG